MATSGPPMRRNQAELNAAVRRRMIQVAIMVLIVALSLFLSAGDFRWLMGWLFVAIYIGMIAVNALILLPRDPELIAERGEIRADAKRWDKWVGTFAMLMMLPGELVVAGLDRRSGWSVDFPEALLWVGFAAMIGSQALFSWAMMSNRFFSAAVRIQTERGHTVQSGGPYRFVRHPGYVGSVIGAIAAPVMLGSWWALIPGVMGAVGMIVRTALEDRTLHEELPGYAEYAQKTRYRLLPGLW